jgi:glutathione peroxidase
MNIFVSIVMMQLFILNPNSIYDFKIKSLDGKHTIDFAEFKGKKILIVNTASECGYTPQYAGLQELSVHFKDKLVVIGFPCNDFGQQEPGTPEQIASFCSKNYQVTFPMTEKVKVLGDDKHPIFKWLLEQTGVELTGDIKWNFEKFLIDENGKLVHRFRHKMEPASEEIISAIEK